MKEKQQQIMKRVFQKVKKKEKELREKKRKEPKRKELNVKKW